MLVTSRIPTREERAALLREFERLANRDRRRDFAWTILEGGVLQALLRAYLRGAARRDW